MERPHRDWVGSLVGILVFAGGIGLLVLTFKLAYAMFEVPPMQALKLSSSKTMDFATTGGSLAGILIRTLLLVVMGFVSSIIANRGIHLYSHSLIRTGRMPHTDPGA